YYLCSILDGCSRSIVHWEIREAMKEADAEIVLQRAREKYPQARPQIISDNGPQFVAKDFKEFLRLWQTTHVYTSPHYPQSNGKRRESDDASAEPTWRSFCEHRSLARLGKFAETPCVHSEDRALLGSNPSAAVDSNTAGLGGASRPGRPPAGSTTKRKIPGVR